MKDRSKYLFLALAFFAIGAVFSFTLTPTVPASSGATGAFVGFVNEVVVEHCSAKTGKCEQQVTHNVVTEEGVNWTRDVISGFSSVNQNESVTTINYGNWTVLELSSATSVGFSNSTCADVVTGNGLGIQQATTIYRTTVGNFTMNATWTKTGGATQTVRVVCVSNNTASASVDLMAAALLSSAVNMETSDQLTVSYRIAMVNGTS